MKDYVLAVIIALSVVAVIIVLFAFLEWLIGGNHKNGK